MASATETSPLVSSKDSSGETVSPDEGVKKTSCKLRMGLLALLTEIFIILFMVFQVGGVLVYCALTYLCGKYEKHPHYNCEKGPEIIGIDQRGAMILELTVASSQVVSRIIFSCFGLKSVLKNRGSIWREFLKPVGKLSQTWVLLITWCFCEFRLVFILSDDDDLGEELEIAKTTNAMYVIDAFAMTTVVIILHFVKLNDLTEDCGIRVTKWVLKGVLSSFWFQYALYFLATLFQLAFHLYDVDKNFVGEEEQEAVNMLKRIGQLAFMTKICAYLWDKLFDDNKSILGTKTD